MSGRKHLKPPTPEAPFVEISASDVLAVVCGVQIVSPRLLCLEYSTMMPTKNMSVGWRSAPEAMPQMTWRPFLVNVRHACTVCAATGTFGSGSWH